MKSHGDELPALLGSRICHDLISPLGAIANGVELLAMAGAMQGPELSLITESIESANARIRLYRVAFGWGAPGQAIGRAEITGILAGLGNADRRRIDWQVQNDQPRGDIKLAFLLLMCCETAMPFGGTVTVREADGRWTVAGTAEKLKLDAGLWAVAADPLAAAEITPALVHFALVPGALRDSGRSLTTELGERQIVLRF